ncbi:DNA-binding protein SATB1 [Trichinella spiralis]|uniref:DNA-binding protein SATB1 n=1 Tax=Trichinella spiralis TaxID=6334 RepID=A0A0V1BWE6_TRISP|nr:DNA-binding protein SATB1 [Trichinella spiralis]
MKGAHPSIHPSRLGQHVPQHTPDARSSPAAAAAAHAHAHSFIYAHHLPINKHENPTHYHLLAHALRHAYTHTHTPHIDCCAAELLFDIPFLPCIYLIEPAENSLSRRVWFCFFYFSFSLYFFIRVKFSFNHFISSRDQKRETFERWLFSYFLSILTFLHTTVKATIKGSSIDMIIFTHSTDGSQNFSLQRKAAVGRRRRFAVACMPRYWTE